MFIRLRPNKVTVGLSYMVLGAIIAVLLGMQLTKPYDVRGESIPSSESPDYCVKEDAAKPYSDSEGGQHNYLGLWHNSKGQYVIEPIYKYTSIDYLDGLTLLKGEEEFDGEQQYTLLDANGNKLFEKSFPHAEGAWRVFTFYNKNYVYTYLTDNGSGFNSKARHDYEYFNYDGTPVAGFAKWVLNGGQTIIVLLSLLIGIILGLLVNGLIAPKKYRVFDLRK